jgi:cobalt/nickel transport system ATP-binding protein
VNTPAIELRGLRYAYPDGTAALHGLNLSIAPGEAVAVVGANGAGKSTLLLHLNGLLLAGAGEVHVGGVLVTRSTLRHVRRTVGYVFQDADDQLFMPTVQDDVAFGPVNQALPPHEVEKRAVAIAGVLAMAPSVLVLDEPSSGLDPAARRRLIELLRGLDQTRVIATHDLDLVIDVCERVLVMREGKVHADGPPAALLADASLLKRCHLEPPPGGLDRARVIR